MVFKKLNSIYCKLLFFHDSIPIPIPTPNSDTGTNTLLTPFDCLLQVPSGSELGIPGRDRFCIPPFLNRFMVFKKLNSIYCNFLFFNDSIPIPIPTPNSDIRTKNCLPLFVCFQSPRGRNSESGSGSFLKHSIPQSPLWYLKN